jgi:hypothetical protein
LFEIDITPLEQQKHNREFELLVQTCIMNTIRDKIPVETILRQFIDETQEVEVTKVEKLVEQKPFVEPRAQVEPTVQVETRGQVEPKAQIEQNSHMLDTKQPLISKQSNDMPSFFENKSNYNSNELNDEIDKFEKIAQQNTIINSATTHKVGFTNNNSVLTFESPPSEDAISLGEPLQLNELEFEDLDVSKTSEPVKLEFEEL